MFLLIQISLLCCEILAVSSLFIPHSNTIQAERSSMTAFRNFMALHHRNYTNDEETAKRFKIFKQNLAYIDSLNAKYNGTIFGITEFADYTPEELRKIGLKLPAHYDDLLMTPYADKVYSSLPTHFDWRDQGKVTSVKHQGECNSCWAFAAVAVVESKEAIKGGTLTDLSVQQVVDCAEGSDGCRSGYASSAYRVAKDKGLLTENEYPYYGYQQSTCPPRKGSVFVQSIERLGRDADQIASYVHTHGPVSVSVRLTPSLYFYYYDIYKPTKEECLSSPLYHTFTVVGFGERGDEKYWILKNSWGESWGLYGYVYYARGGNDCDIESYAFSAVV